MTVLIPSHGSNQRSPSKEGYPSAHSKTLASKHLPCEAQCVLGKDDESIRWNHYKTLHIDEFMVTTCFKCYGPTQCTRPKSCDLILHYLDHVYFFLEWGCMCGIFDSIKFRTLWIYQSFKFYEYIISVLENIIWYELTHKKCAVILPK